VAPVIFVARGGAGDKQLAIAARPDHFCSSRTIGRIFCFSPRASVGRSACSDDAFLVDQEGLGTPYTP